MGIRNSLKKAGERAGGKVANKVAKLAALSSDQIETAQKQREDYLTELPDPGDDVAIKTTQRMMAAGSIEIFNAYLSQIKQLYIPVG